MHYHLKKKKIKKSKASKRTQGADSAKKLKKLQNIFHLGAIKLLINKDSSKQKIIFSSLSLIPMSQLYMDEELGPSLKCYKSSFSKQQNMHFG